MITVDDHSRTYYEMLFAQMKQNRGGTIEAMSESGASSEVPTSAIEPAVKRSLLAFEAKKTGETLTINGFPCEHAIITGTTTGKITQTKQTCSMAVTADVWPPRRGRRIWTRRRRTCAGRPRRWGSSLGWRR